MIYTFKERNLIINHLVKEVLYYELDIDIEFENFHLENLHDHFSSETKPQLLNKIYTLFREKKFQIEYDKLCNILKEEFHTPDTRFQSIPSVRIQMPGDKSVDFHADVFYGHGKNIVNYWMPITKVCGNNSMFVLSENESENLIQETKKLKESVIDFNKKCHSASKPLEINYGEIFKFNSQTLHGTVFNDTDSSRVSIDFRMVIDNDDIGLKDQSFFILDRKTVTKETKPKRAMLYFNRENKEEKLPSQKYQQLICLEYCQEKNITPVRLETELSGFDYFPTLFHISENCKDENFRDIVIFSKENLPDSIELKNKFIDIAKKNNLVVHYVFEDEIEEY
jgi:sporadic carbohydrate cluster 2OG-Fe(II) oxygenase